MSVVRAPVDLARAGLAALDDIAAITAAAFDPRFGEAWSSAQLAGSLGQPGSWARIACAGGAPRGFTLCRRLVDEAELLLVAVVPPARGQGIGAALLGAACDDARGDGASALFLEMRDGNAAADALYRALGFVEVGRRRDYYRGADARRFDAITMRRDLTAGV